MKHSDFRILILTPQLKIGGTEKHILKLSVALKQSGITPIIVCIQPNDICSPIYSELIASAIPTYFFKLGPLHPINFVKLLRLIRKERINIIHSFLYGNVVWDSLLYICSRSKIFITERRNLHHWRLTNRIGIYERLRNFTTSEIVSNSRKVKEITIDIEGVPEDKIRLIYNGVDEFCKISNAQKNLARSNMGFKKDDFIAINVANLKDIKNQEEIIYAISDFYTNKIYANFILLLIGRPDNKYEKKLRLLCRKFFLEDNVLFIGEQKSIKNYMVISDVFVLSSLSEGFSNAIIEALSYGVPVISSNVGGVSEVIKPALNGYIYESGDTFHLRDLLEKLYFNPGLRNRLSKNAFNTSANFRMDVVTKNYLELYKSHM